MCRLVPLLLFAGVAAACADPYRPPAGDLDPPFVVGSEPGAGATDVGRRPELRVEFSEPIDPASLHEAALLVLSPVAAIAGEVRAEERAAVFVPAADLREGTDYRLVVRRTVRDVAGVALAGDEGPGTDAAIAFRTAAVSPTVTAVTPADGTVDVAYDPAAPVTIRFSEPMEPATVDDRAVIVRDREGPVPGTVALDAAGLVATFTPDGPWREGRSYEVEVAAACADASGIPLAAPAHAGFTTASDPPVLDAREPPGPVALAGYAAVFLASEPLDPATVQRWNITVDPPTDARVAWVPETRLIKVAFPALLSSVAYTVTAGTGIADDDGNHLAAPVAFHFTTSATVDNHPPAPIGDLDATSPGRSVLRLEWTAPGDDGAVGAAAGTATAYEVRRSASPIHTLADFEAASPVPAEAPAPGPAGSHELLDLFPGLYEPWHYAVLAVDEAGNHALSNDLLAAVTLREERAAGTVAGGELGGALLLADLDADGSRELIVGEPGADRVRIFPGSPNGPSLTTSPRTLSGPAGSRFGAALAAGDVNADGHADLLVGAPAEDGERGAAYLYPGVDAPDVGAPVVFRGAELRDRLGTAVALADLDGDGAAETIVGAPGGGAANQGAVLIAKGGAAVPPPVLFAAGADAGPGYSGQIDSDPRGEGRDVVARALPDPLLAVTIAGAEPGEAYGSALAVADLDGDRVPDLAIGAPGADANGVDAGRIELRIGGTVRQLQGPDAGGFFGASLAAGDLDGDDLADLVAGAPFAAGVDGEGFPAPDAGAVHLYAGPIADRATPAWSARGLSAGARLGAAVAVTGPLLDGSAGGIAAGAPGASGADRSGAVHLFHVGADRTVTANGVLPGPEAFDGFGACVAPAGDLDGDRLDDLAVGAPFADGAAPTAGRVHLFR